MNTDLRVHKLDESGEEVWGYPARCLEETDAFVRVEARFDRDRVDVGSLTLLRGDRFVETYYFYRWYNVFEVFDADGVVFKGWYCNIARPARKEGIDLYAEDLALDLVVTPDGGVEVLDEQEFEALAITDRDRQQARRALESLIIDAHQRSGIFRDTPSGD